MGKKIQVEGTARMNTLGVQSVFGEISSVCVTPLHVGAVGRLRKQELDLFIWEKEHTE